MKKKICVFKAWGGNCWLRVLAVRKRPEQPIVYRVMMGRNLLDGINEFEEKSGAIDKAVRLAKADALGAMEGLFI